MPPIKTVRVQNVRAHTNFSVDLSPTVTVITGPNGSGKTSLIEALYIALQGSSFKGGDGDVLRRDTSWYRIDITHEEDDTTRVVKFDSERQTGRKQFEVGGKTQYRLSHQYKYPVVLFEPDDLRLMSGSPTRRRRFIDLLIGQLDPEYVIATRRYERALKQRNALLKMHGNTNDLFAWNVSLSKYGAYIISKRIEYIAKIQQDLGSIYTGISHTSDTIDITYSQGYPGSIEQKLLADLDNYIEKDRILGFTSTGPHRHDILFNFNNTPAILGASRGEIRTIILALKFIEVAIIESTISKRPLILLDDVFSELDAMRQTALVDQFKTHQTVIASVNTVTENGLVIELAG